MEGEGQISSRWRWEGGLEGARGHWLVSTCLSPHLTLGHLLWGLSYRICKMEWNGSEVSRVGEAGACPKGAECKFCLSWPVTLGDSLGLRQQGRQCQPHCVLEGIEGDEAE